MQGTFTVAGQRVRTSSQRRYVSWYVRRDGLYPPSIFRRSDSLDTLRTAIRRQGFGSGGYFVIIDTRTGEERAA